MSKEFIRQLSETELIEYAMQHIVPAPYKYERSFEEDDDSSIGIIFVNKTIFNINITEPILVLFDDFGYSVHGGSDKYKERRENIYLETTWKKLMIKKFGEKYVSACKSEIKKDYDRRRTRLDKQEANAIMEIDELAKIVFSSES